jgi:hypothetical protein
LVSSLERTRSTMSLGAALQFILIDFGAGPPLRMAWVEDAQSGLV